MVVEPSLTRRPITREKTGARAMDLHAWIAQQVDRAELTGRHITLVPDDGSHVISGSVTDVAHGPDGLSLSVAQHGVEPTVDAATLRRCEADRRILARHCLDPAKVDSWMFATACLGCGTEGDFQDPVTENLNDCPELLDLAHAHGITTEILAGLDRPQAPEREPRGPVDPVLAGIFARTFGLATPVITTAGVPEALRGPHWKPAP
ncbi:hypothetical protein GCM10011583_18110 [Streptomyces camponoticapitis]|uniref:Uncharacterized protein n=1 Tax=Streptomyces camponoticapitis TaxID=1616125 RepID=A0ABQ2E1E4_9ACTN|nr:hypothetical protein [Streptomyces camponoticapitis]GGJ86902.1 hypothetical protein GCM10011583_18110 [Streptomyces camponoticapitis]